MAFTKTTWVDGSAPAITASQLNRIETGIDEAHSGDIDAGAIGTTELASNAVTTTKINDGAVTTAKTNFVLGGNLQGMYFGRIDSAGAAVSLPSGWSSSRIALGAFRITHGLGTTAVALVATTSLTDAVTVIAQPDTTTTFLLRAYDETGAARDCFISFIALRY